MGDLLIRQTFFHQMLETSQFAKLSRYTVYDMLHKQTYIYITLNLSFLEEFLFGKAHENNYLCIVTIPTVCVNMCTHTVVTVCH